jgi:hypothetical protein
VLSFQLLQCLGHHLWFFFLLLLITKMQTSTCLPLVWEKRGVSSWAASMIWQNLRFCNFLLTRISYKPFTSVGWAASLHLFTGMLLPGVPSPLLSVSLADWIQSSSCWFCLVQKERKKKKRWHLLSAVYWNSTVSFTSNLGLAIETMALLGTLAFL